MLIMLDDVGFGAPSTFGGPCETPVFDRLARNGLRYTRFHTTALCSPSRAALLSGRNHHSVGMGGVTEIATSAPGYNSMRPDAKAPLAEILKLNGYSTAQFGKCHEVPVWQTSPAGPFDAWPTGGGGFEYFYGFIGGETNQYEPALYEGTSPVDPPKTPEEGYHLTEDLTDQAIAWVRRQKTLMLTRRHTEIPAWEEILAEFRPMLARQMEVYAGFLTHTDHHIGRLVAALEELGILDETLLYVITGDNGASAEGGLRGSFNEMIAFNGMAQVETPEFMAARIDKFGSPEAYNHYAVGWAHAMDTPYQWTKQVASHWGGTRNGTIVHWPSRIRGSPATAAASVHWVQVDTGPNDADHYIRPEDRIRIAMGRQ